MKENTSNKMKGLSKIISIIAKINSILIAIAGIFVISTMAVSPVIVSNIKVTDNNITIFRHNYDYKVTEGRIKIDNKVIGKDAFHTFPAVINMFQENSKIVIVFIIESALAFVVATFVFIYATLINAYKLFKNIAEGYTPFTESNINHIKVIAKYMIIAVIMSAVGGSIIQKITNYGFGLDINLIEVLSILILFSLAYIFEYGYKLQQEIDTTL